MIDRKESKAGNNLYLSLDSDLQIAVYNLLEQEIAGIVYSNIDNPSSDIPIPITDVYFALINNNVIDLSHFDSTDASTAEQSVSAIFSARQDVVKSQLREQLTGSTPTDFKDLSEEEQDYFTYIIRRLRKNNILADSNIDTSDEVYQQWQQGECSPKDYLNHAIAQNWIDITQFTVDEKYSDSTEIYDALCNYILEELFYEKDFSKIIYEYLITGGQISGTQLCLILFDQGVLPYNEEEIAALNNGSVTAVSF